MAGNQQGELSNEYAVSWVQSFGSELVGISLGANKDIHLGMQDGATSNNYILAEGGEPLSISGNLIPSNSSGYLYRVGDVSSTSDGGTIRAGNVVDSSSPSLNLNILKTSPDGAVQWNKTFSTPTNDWINEIAVSQQDAIVGVGQRTDYPASFYKGLLVKYEPDGDIDWSKEFVPNNATAFTTTYLEDVKIDSSGDIVLVGTTQNPGSSFISKFDTAGNLLWSQNTGGYDAISDVAIDRFDNIYALSGSSGILNKYSENGELQWSIDVANQNEPVQDIDIQGDRVYLVTSDDIGTAYAGDDALKLLTLDLDGNEASQSVFKEISGDNGFRLDELELDVYSGGNEVAIAGNGWVANVLSSGTDPVPIVRNLAVFSTDTASASGLEGLNLDVGGVANVQAPVTLKSTSDASTVEGNVKYDAHATDVLGISTSTLHAASDLSVGSALQSIVTGSAESTSGIAIANALVDTQHGIDLTDTNGFDALASGGSATIVSTSSLTATSNAQTVGDGSSDSGARLLDGAWANTIAEDHLGLGSTGILTLDSESNATVSTSMVSSLTSTATANDGLAVATAQLLSSTGIENLNAEVGGLGLVTTINQGVFKADATSTTDDASVLGINKASAGILDSTFTFGITDSTITAKDFNSLEITATSTGGDAWSKLQSSSTGLADLSGIENRITNAGTISAIASDQGFAHSATVSGSSTAFASQEAVGMSGYEVHNHSDLTLSAQALVTSEANSSAVGG